MCYLPLSCLKAIEGTGAFICILMSLGMLALTIYANIEKKEIINKSGISLVNDFLIGLYLGSAIFMILGICGLYGAIQAKKKKGSGTCLLGLYFLGVFAFFVLFAGTGIFFLVGPETIFGADCTQGKSDLIKQLHDLNEKADKAFCGQECPCYINDTKSELYTWLVDNSYNVSTTLQTNVNYQACLDKEQQKDSNILLMDALERMLDCGGWCNNDKAKFYKFSDINKCQTKQCVQPNKLSCHDGFKNFLTDKGRFIGYGCLIAMGVCLFNMIILCCICTHPDRRGKGSNFYARMMDQD